MKEIPTSILWHHDHDELKGGQPDLGSGSNEVRASGDIPTQATPESEINERARRIRRLEKNWTAKPPGTDGEKLSSENYLFDGRYRHPRSNKKPDIPEV